jgi:hypothetical protein
MREHPYGGAPVSDKGDRLRKRNVDGSPIFMPVRKFTCVLKRKEVTPWWAPLDELLVGFVTYLVNCYHSAIARTIA